MPRAGVLCACLVAFGCGPSEDKGGKAHPMPGVPDGG